MASRRHTTRSSTATTRWREQHRGHAEAGYRGPVLSCVLSTALGGRGRAHKGGNRVNEAPKEVPHIGTIASAGHFVAKAAMVTAAQADSEQRREQVMYEGTVAVVMGQYMRRSGGKEPARRGLPLSDPVERAMGSAAVLGELRGLEAIWETLEKLGAMEERITELIRFVGSAVATACGEEDWAKSSVESCTQWWSATPPRGLRRLAREPGWQALAGLALQRVRHQIRAVGGCP